MSIVTSSRSASLTETDYNMPDIITATDYYLFGMLRPGRDYSFAWLKGPGYDTDPEDVVYSPVNGTVDPATIAFYGKGYQWEFNAMKQDDEVKGYGNNYSTLFREYDPRLARWLSLDPAFLKYSHQSPFVALNNNPILRIDPLGDDPPEKEKKK